MQTYTIQCADCKKKEIHSARTLRGLLDKLRDEGWAINAPHDTFWCPNCAHAHRNVGRKKAGLAGISGNKDNQNADGVQQIQCSLFGAAGEKPFNG